MTIPSVPPGPTTPPPGPGASAAHGRPAGHVADPFAAKPWLAHYETGVPAEVPIPDLTVDGLLREAAARTPERTALVFFGRRTSYGELDRSVDRFAAALRALGLVPGDRVALHLPTCPAFVIAFLGALRAGCLVVPMNPLYVERELTTLFEQTRPRLSVALDVLVPRLAAVRSRLCDGLPPPAAGPAGPVPIIVTAIHHSMPVPLRWLYPIRARREGRWHPVRHTTTTPDLFRLVAETPHQPIPSAARPADAALLQPTGGTTGLPKAAVLTHRNLVANAIQVAAWFPVSTREGDAILCTLPYFHIYGLTVALGYALLRGSTQLLHPRFDPPTVLRSIARDRPRLFPGAPTMYATLLKQPDLGRFDLSSIEACISGAAPLPKAVQDGFEAATGGRVSEGYGLTEASPVTHCNPIGGERRLGTVGLPFPSTEARIVDFATGGQVVGIGEVGELQVRGPQVFAGYWERPEESARALQDGWLSTGDMATMDEDGYFRIVDRRKELIIVGGINVYPREVEEVLAMHPAVGEAAAVGLPDAVKGEVVSAYVVLRAGASATVEDLLAHCRQNLARYKVPAVLEIRQDLPRSMIGKVLRRVLAEERAARDIEG